MSIRWKDLGLAFLLAVGLWYLVSGSEKIETQIDVRLDYKGIPANMVVQGGMVNKVAVRLRATAGVARAMYGREYMYSMNLASVIQGENILQIPVSQLPFLGGVEVIDVQPHSIILQVDTIETRDVPISLALTTDLPPDYTVTAFLDKEMVTVKGPSGSMKKLESLVVPLHVDGAPQEGKSVVIKQIPSPQDMEVIPPTTRVNLEIEVARTRMDFEIPVAILDADGNKVDLGKHLVRIVVDVPKSMATTKVMSQALLAEASLPPGVATTPEALADILIPVVGRLPLSCNLVQVEPKALTFGN